MEESIFLREPCEINLAVLGMTPVSAKFLIISRGTPSSPIMMVFDFCAIVSVYHSDNSAGTDVLVMDEDKAA